jgi:hypothetical protein
LVRKLDIIVRRRAEAGKMALHKLRKFSRKTRRTHQKLFHASNEPINATILMMMECRRTMLMTIQRKLLVRCYENFKFKFLSTFLSFLYIKNRLICICRWSYWISDDNERSFFSSLKMIHGHHANRYGEYLFFTFTLLPSSARLGNFLVLLFCNVAGRTLPNWISVTHTSTENIKYYKEGRK